MKRKWLATPYIVWMCIFIVIPMFLVLYYAFTVDASGGRVAFSLENFEKFFQPVYLSVLWRSLVMALLSTIICLLIGYPTAMILASRDFSKAGTLLLLFMVPMWMNFLLRTYAWKAILENTGIINSFLQAIGLEPVQMLYTSGAVVFGMVYNYLPFMILPIYTSLKKIDRSLIEAAQDLGGRPSRVFRKVTFPLSLPGVMSGVTMVFMPAVSTFVISRLLGGAQFMLFGDLIEQQFIFANDWHFGSTLSIIMMALILISMGIFYRYDDEEGGRLW
ncbi:ABC transporter permease [Gehongia tenuis]|uniref:ABC transporter permease n=1 Tax=Gehongia tenuis TaxID=2763655 RepID=A0A926D7P0_9FIRM|nr:ABC transporter permease [Gehongia tenuis]MBC8531885.1 ABC transporter permease [Gehongia tenuis]